MALPKVPSLRMSFQIFSFSSVEYLPQIKCQITRRFNPIEIAINMAEIITNFKLLPKDDKEYIAQHNSDSDKNV